MALASEVSVYKSQECIALLRKNRKNCLKEEFTMSPDTKKIKKYFSNCEITDGNKSIFPLEIVFFNSTPTYALSSLCHKPRGLK